LSDQTYTVKGFLDNQRGERRYSEAEQSYGSKAAESMQEKHVKRRPDAGV